MSMQMATVNGGHDAQPDDHPIIISTSPFASSPLHTSPTAHTTTSLPPNHLPSSSSSFSRGEAVASTIAERWLHPTPSLRISVHPASSSDPALSKAPLTTTADTMYARFVSTHASRRPLRHHRTPPDMMASVMPWCLQWPLFFHGYLADSHVQRGTAVVYLTLCLVGCAYRNSPWFWYVLSGMCADAGLRVAGGDRLAVVSTIVEMLTMWLPRAYMVASAPRQFAWLLYTALLLASVFVTGYIIDGDADHHALLTLLAVLSLLFLLEIIGLSLPALLFTRLTRAGLIPDHYQHKASWTLSQQQLKAATGQAKMASTPSKHAVLVSTDEGQPLLRFDALTLAARTTFDPIRNLSIGYAFPLLGVAGLTDLFFYGSEFAGLNSYVWKALAICLGFLYLTFWVLQLVRFTLVPGAIMRELTHPHMRYPFFLILAIPLLSIDFMQPISEHYAKVIFWLCSPLVIAAVIQLLRDWITQPMQFELFNASWLIASIPLGLAAFEYPIAYPDSPEYAWLWLGFGIFLWSLMVALTLCRLFFLGPLPDSQRATLFLLMSTGAIFTAAIVFQDPQAVNLLVGPYGTLAQFFHWFTTFLALICYVLLLTGYFCRMPFNMSYWAISFPSSALALIYLFYWKIGNCDLLSAPTQQSSEELCENNQTSDGLKGLTILFFVNAALSNSILFVNTVLAALQKRLFTPVPQWSPAVAMQLQHFAFRTALYKAKAALDTLNGTSPPTPPRVMPFYHTSWCQEPVSAEYPPKGRVAMGREEVAADCAQLLVMLDVALQMYMRVKRDILWPAVQAWIPEVDIPHTDTTELTFVREMLYPILATLSLPSPSHAELTDAQERLKTLSGRLHLHLDHEEVVLTPLVHTFTTLPAATGIMRQVWRDVDRQTLRVVLPWVVQTMPDHVVRMAFIDCWGWAEPEAMAMMSRWLQDAVDPFLYDQLCVDYPTLKQRVPSPYAKTW